MRLSRAPAVLLLVVATACSTASNASNASGELRVVTTVAPLTSIAANIAGTHARITGLVPEGTNSHTFEPPPSVAEALAKADLIFVNGLKLEDPTAELAAQTKSGDAEIVSIGNLVLAEGKWIYDFSFPRKDGKPNPHLWTDPELAIGYAEVIHDALVRRDDAHRADYDTNLAAFRAKATALSAALRRDQATIPGKRELLTYHDAYAYFGRDYGWTILGAVQPSNFDDPAPAEIARLITQIRREKVPAIFGSEVFPSKALEEIGRASGARYIDTLRDDDLPGKPGDAEHSWLGLMRTDFVTMVEGLGGHATVLRALDVSDVTPDHADYPQ